MPAVARHRRSVGDEVGITIISYHHQIAMITFQANLLQERSHLDTAITFMGAFFGMQNCSKVLMEGETQKY